MHSKLFDSWVIHNKDVCRDCFPSISGPPSHSLMGNIIEYVIHFSPPPPHQQLDSLWNNKNNNNTYKRRETAALCIGHIISIFRSMNCFIIVKCNSYAYIFYVHTFLIMHFFHRVVKICVLLFNQCVLYC